MMHRGGEPRNGDFVAYIERITGKPPSSPGEIARVARRAAAERAAPRPASGAPASGSAPENARRPSQLPDFDLALLVPIARGLTIAGFVIIAAAILLDEWFPLPSPFAGVVLVVLGMILRRTARGGLGSPPPSRTRKT